MENNGGFTEMWGSLLEKISGLTGRITALFRGSRPAGDETDLDAQETAVVEDASDTPLGKVTRIVKTIGLWLFRLRKVFMAIPVIWFSGKLASYNMENLPEQVGLNLQANGSYAQMIDRSLAVHGPLWITAACLLLMFCSRRARYPWAISIFSLVLPLLILLTNLYPQ